MQDLNDLEKDVLAMLLSGEGDALRQLREQLAVCRVEERKLTGAGFVTELHIPEDVHPADEIQARARVGDVVAELEGVEYGVGFVLFIRQGLLGTLEGYTFEEPWPESIAKYDLRYQSSSRDLSELLR